jgi:DNA-binding PadR family transcriptional regulator
MRHPVDDLLIALSHGLEGWMFGSTTDAIEIASFLRATGKRAIPRTPEAIEGLLQDMETAGLVERRRPDSSVAGSQQFQTFALTEQGWARAAALDAE